MNPTVTLMKELKNYHGNSLNYDNINFSDYFRSLSSEGARQSLLDDKQFSDIKNQIGQLLSRTISSYTGNESTSVMRDTANDIFTSILYCLDMCLFTCESHESALEFIAENSIDDIYSNGQKVIKQCVFECISLLVKLKKNRINFPDRSYNSILDGDIMSYLKKYDSIYFAHGTKRIFPYLSVNGCGGYRGILHLKKYLENLIFENEFVNRHDENVIQNLCYGFCEANGLEYNDIKTNIYSIVLMNMIFAVLTEKGGIEIDKNDATKLTRQLRKYPEPMIRKMILQAAEKVSSENYVQISAIKLAGHLVNAINNNDLNKVIYIGELK